MRLFTDYPSSPRYHPKMDSNNWRVKRDPGDAPPKEQMRTPLRSHQPRNNDSSFAGNSNSSFGSNYGNRGSPFGQQSRDSLRKPLGDSKVDKAIEEGRRVYVGNMPYEVSLDC